ncbi:arginine-glutamic acid dipeptide repeats protein-like isoform X2 [Corticium candelabrum]|uniref:arginine-glutamic acid dipeptide repeats protein-like isoform X2 n=1 Tax=Corticium candelabrum TaxID=121492 RepID=UPI002E2580A5|nr:arginine-glutamic acid dipeptide repeats protein-like isoform X2 [Corticium candelabrum]
MMSDQEETEAFSETRSYRRGRASGERGRSRGRGGGKVTGKSRASESTGSDRQLTCYSAEDGTDYRIGDCVYVDSQRADVPYFICTVKEFRVSKRCNVHVSVGWFFRPSEVPESVYDLLVQDRGVERGPDNVFENVTVIQRELFMSDTCEVYPAKLLRGKCFVKDAKTNVENLEEYTKQEDTFFYFFAYNPETRRLNSTQGEIRIGPSHQTSLPRCRDQKLALGDVEHPPDQPVWSTEDKIKDADVEVYLDASKSLTHYSGWCKTNGDLEEACQIASSDLALQVAHDRLHDNLYNPGTALEEILRQPVYLSGSKSWPHSDVKLFVKGLRQFGKNFYRIKKVLFPHKQTGELVEFYYHWKKSSSAMSTRPHKRYRRQPVMRRTRVATRAAKASQPNEFVSLSSASESDFDSDDSGERELSGYACHHCYTMASKDWHHAGFDKVLLCTDCRLYFKRYGEMRKVKVPKVPPTCLLKTGDESKSRRRKDRENGFEVDGSGKRHSNNNRRVTRLQKRKLNGGLVSAVTRKRVGKRKSQPRGKRRCRVKAGSSASSDTADLGDVESEEAGNRTPQSGFEDESASSGEAENGSSLTSVADDEEDAALPSRGRPRRPRQQAHEDHSKLRAVRRDFFPRVNGREQNNSVNSQPRVEDWTQSPALWASNQVPQVVYPGLPPGFTINPQHDLSLAFQPCVPAGLGPTPSLEEISRMQMAACPTLEMGLTEELVHHQQLADLQALGIMLPHQYHLITHPLAQTAGFHSPERISTDFSALMQQQAASRRDPVQAHNQMLLEQALAERAAAQWHANSLLARPNPVTEYLAHQQLAAAHYELYERVRQELLLHDRHRETAEAMIYGLTPNLPSHSFPHQSHVRPNPG